jgi:hypothetical protein
MGVAAMKSLRQQNLHDLLVFALLVAIGVAGRWGQPQWSVTPTAAAAIFAGLYFSRIGIALLMPISILAISDILLPAHDSIPVMISTYSMMTLPVWFGRIQRGEQPRWLKFTRWGLFALLPATLFYLVTNFAVWAFQSDYEKTLPGLVECYVAAIPFFRWMLAGDVFYIAVLLGCLAMARVPAFETGTAEA